MQTPDPIASQGGTLPPLAERKARTPDELRTAMSLTIASGDPKMAEALVREVARDHPGDSSLRSALAKCTDLVDRATWLDSALNFIRGDLEEDRFADAVGRFRQALTLSRGFTLLKARVDREAEQQADKLLPQNWRVAETLLQEASAVAPPLVVNKALSERLKRAKDDEALTHAIYKADRAGLEGRTEEARRRLTELLEAHPGESRIKERLKALDQPVAATTAPAAPEATPEATTQVVQEPLPSDSELDEEGTPNEGTTGFSLPWRTRVIIANSTWNAVKNFSAMAATTAMLGIAGVLIWQHFSSPSSKTVVAKPHPVQQPHLAPASLPVIQRSVLSPDEEAWEMVKASDNPTDIQAFLSTYPASPHVFRAQVKLASIQWNKIDKSSPKALANYLRLNPDTPYKAEAQRTLSSLRTPTESDDRAAILQTVKLYEQEQSLNWDGVLDEPVIKGNEASVDYHPKAPAGASVLTFSLIRQNDVWKVQGMR